MTAETFAIVSTTVGGEPEARELARALVEAKLAACVQIMRVASIYRWEGAVEEADEHLLLCKIAAASFAEVEAEIRSRHSYDVPEIVMVPIQRGSAPYMAWLAAETDRAQQNGDARESAAVRDGDQTARPTR